MSRILLVGQAVSNWKAEYLELRSYVYQSLLVWQQRPQPFVTLKMLVCKDPTFGVKTLRLQG